MRRFSEADLPTAKQDNDLYEVIIIESGKDYAVLCPGVPGAVSQGADREAALKMIADAMAMAQMHPLPGDDTAERRTELRVSGRTRIKELVAECEPEGLEHYVFEVAPQLISHG